MSLPPLEYVEVEQLFEDDSGRCFWWKRCEHVHCARQVYLKGDGKHCYPHQSLLHAFLARVRGVIRT